MSAIYRPARKAAKSVAKAVSKPIKWVGDTVEDVGEWAVEEVFDPVIEELENRYKQIADDPVYYAAKAIAISTGQAAWALPLIEGAKVSSEGGDVGDVLAASAKAYVAAEISGSAAGDLGAEATAEEIFKAAATEQVTIALAQEAIDRVAKDAFGDDDPPPEIEEVFYGSDAVEPLSEELKDSVQEVSDSYQSAEAKADEIDQMNSAYQEKAGQYNEYADTLDGKINTQNELKDEVDELQ
jgi:FtsZ-binding cell division protein ZapB